MTLQEWETKYNHKSIQWVMNYIKYIPDFYVNTILPFNNERSELWNLSDYRVSSVSGGTIWLYKK